MKRLRLTEGGKIALWLDARDKPAIVWAFKDAQMPYIGTVTDLASEVSVKATGAATFRKGGVYRLGRS